MTEVEIKEIEKLQEELRVVCLESNLEPDQFLAAVVGLNKAVNESL